VRHRRLLIFIGYGAGTSLFPIAGERLSFGNIHDDERDGALYLIDINIIFMM